MLDIRRLRTEPDLVKTAMKNRGKDLDSAIDEIIELDAQRRALSTQADTLKAEQNRGSKAIPAMKKAGEDTAPLMERMRLVADEVKELEGRMAEIDARLSELMYGLPNVPHESVPIGLSDTDNVEVRRHVSTEFPYEPDPIGKSAPTVLDPKRPQGAGTFSHTKSGRRLERAVYNY